MKSILVCIILCCSFTATFAQSTNRVSVSDVVLLDFKASWCGYCRKMEPLIKRISSAGWTVKHINVDTERNLAHQFGVRGVPCYVLLVKGKEVGRINGTASYYDFQKLYAKIRSTRRVSYNAQTVGIEDPLPQKLMNVLISLQQQDFVASSTILHQAAVLPDVDHDRVERWEKLLYYAKEFTTYRDKALSAVVAGNNYIVDDVHLGVVEIDREKFIYRARGKNIRFHRKDIPLDIVMAIVEDWFDEKPANHLFLGAYYATKPDIDIQRAKKHWQIAQKGGFGVDEDASMLLEILNEPMFQDGYSFILKEEI